MTEHLPVAPHAEVIAEVAEAAARLEAEGALPAGFLARVRGAAARMGAADVAADDIRGSLALVEGLMTIDVEAPAASSRRTVVLAKRGFRRVARWYLRHLAQQVTSLGEAILRAETAMAGRLETVEQRVEEFAGLRERVEQLEATIGTGSDAGAAEARVIDEKPDHPPDSSGS